MPTTDHASFERGFLEQTTTYLDELEACVALLPDLVDQYAEGRSYRQCAAEIRAIETSCDRINRQLSSDVGNACATDLGIRLTRIHLHSGEVIELYRILDEIANTAERFAEELVAIEPVRRDDCLVALRSMAKHVVATIPYLLRAVNEYVRVLCHPQDETSVAEEVQRIRDAESEGDRMRNEIVGAAFATGPGVDSLVYRELASLLDSTLDAMEDCTDQMIFITGNQSWIDVEPNSRLV